MQRLDPHDTYNTNLNVDELIKNLTHNFNVVADELETSNRQIHVLTQKLRHATVKVRLPLLLVSISYTLSFMMNNFSSRSGAALSSRDRQTYHVS